MTEQNDLVEDSSIEANSFAITESMLTSLRQTRPWVKFLSILGFVSIFFVVVSGIVNMFVFSKAAFGGSYGLAIFMGAINILMGVLYFFPSFFLFKFASSIARLSDGGGAGELEEALSNQKSFWKFFGIMALVMFGVAILGMAAAIIIPQFVNSPVL